LIGPSGPTEKFEALSGFPKKVAGCYQKAGALVKAARVLEEARIYGDAAALWLK
jgi:hypothetical protein